MISKLLEKLGFKKKKKPLYTKKQFTKYSNYKGDTYVYDSYSNQWSLWYLIADSVDDGSISEFDMIKDNPHDIMEDKDYNESDWMCRDDIDDSSDYFPEEYDFTKEGSLVNNVDVIKEFERTVKSDSYRNFDADRGYSESSNSSESSSSNNSGYSGDSYSSSSDLYSSSSYDSGSSSSFSSFD